MPHSDIQLSVCTSSNFSFHVQRRSIQVGIKILLCHQNGNRSLFVGFLEECCDGNVGGKGCLLSPGRDTRTVYQRMSETRSEQSPDLGQAGRSTGEAGRSLFSMTCINHPIYPSGTSFQSAFRMEWFITMLNCGPDMPISTKNQFFNKGCQGHITLLNTLRENIPFQIPPLVSICLHFI